jgi:hypothetical protein
MVKKIENQYSKYRKLFQNYPLEQKAFVFPKKQSVTPTAYWKQDRSVMKVEMHRISLFFCHGGKTFVKHQHIHHQIPRRCFRQNNAIIFASWPSVPMTNFFLAKQF